MSTAPSKKMLAAMAKFQHDMQKLGLGVSLSINNEPPVVIVEAPLADVIDLDAERAKRRPETAPHVA